MVAIRSPYWLMAVSLASLTACQDARPRLSASELQALALTPGTLPLVLPRRCVPTVTDSYMTPTEAQAITAVTPSGRAGFTYACKVTCANTVDSSADCPEGTVEDPACPDGLTVTQVSNFGYANLQPGETPVQACRRRWEDRKATHPLGCAEFEEDVTRIRDTNGDEYETECVAAPPCGNVGEACCIDGDGNSYCHDEENGTVCDGDVCVQVPGDPDPSDEPLPEDPGGKPTPGKLGL